MPFGFKTRRQRNCEHQKQIQQQLAERRRRQEQFENTYGRCECCGEVQNCLRIGGTANERVAFENSVRLDLSLIGRTCSAHRYFREGEWKKFPEFHIGNAFMRRFCEGLPIPAAPDAASWNGDDSVDPLEDIYHNRPHWRARTNIQLVLNVLEFYICKNCFIRFQLPPFPSAFEIRCSIDTSSPHELELMKQNLERMRELPRIRLILKRLLQLAENNDAAIRAHIDGVETDRTQQAARETVRVAQQIGRFQGLQDATAARLLVAPTPTIVRLPASASHMQASEQMPYVSSVAQPAPSFALGLAPVEDREAPNCSICLTNRNMEDNPMFRTICGHWFHNNCLREHQRRGGPNANRCPNCRRELFLPLSICLP